MMQSSNRIAGIIPRAIVHVFEGKAADEDADTVYDIRLSYIEIYNEEIRYAELSSQRVFMTPCRKAK